MSESERYTITWQTIERHAFTVTETELSSMAGIPPEAIRALPVPIRASLALASPDGIMDAITEREGNDTYQSTTDRDVIRIERYDLATRPEWVSEH